MAEENKLLFIASDICLSEQKSNDIFILIQARLLSTRANRNSQGVTEKFIDEVVANQSKYECLPLYCDTKRLLNGDHKNLGHMLTKDGQFLTTQIGSITSFRKQNDEYGSSLIAQIRVPKRQHLVCDQVIAMYEQGLLNFSFEISYSPQHVLVIDGVQYVDAHEDNVLCGMCLVTTPAYPQSTALMLTAELQGNELGAEKGVEKTMNQEQVSAMVAEAVKAKEEQNALALAEKDAIIAERDAKIEQLNKAIAAKSSEEQEVPSDEKEKEEEVVAECKKDAEAECKKDAEAECKKEDATAEKEDPEQMKDEEKEEEAVAEQKKEACAQVAVASPYEMECMQQEINRLRVELAGAAAAKAELEAIKSEMAAKELEREQAMAKAFAEKQGLDSEDEVVSKAIAELDYKMIAELTMKNDKPVEKEQRIVVASIAGNGFEICGGKWDDLLASRK